MLNLLILLLAFLWGWTSVASAVQKTSTPDEFIRNCLYSVYALTVLTFACWLFLPSSTLIVQVMTMKFSAMLMLSWEKICDRYYTMKK